jgi:hypothetical protein
MAGPYTPSDIKNYVGVGKQTVRGTAVAPTAFAAYIDAVDLDHAQAINKIFEAGTYGSPSYAEKVAHMPVGGFTYLVRPSIGAKLQAYQLGVDTISGPVVTVYTHPLTSDAITDYISVEQNLADEGIERFRDCVIAEIVYSCSVDAPALRAKATWAGGAPLFQAAPTAESYETEEPFLLSECAFTIDGAGNTLVKSFDLTTRMRMSLERVGGGTDSVVSTWVIKVGHEIELSLTTLVDDIDTDYRATHYGSAAGTTHQTTAKTGAFIADFTRGAAATLRECKLHVPGLVYESAKYTALDPGGSDAVQLERTAFGKKAAGSELFTATFQNLDAAAYV